MLHRVRSSAGGRGSGGGHETAGKNEETRGAKYANTAAVNGCGGGDKTLKSRISDAGK